MAKKKAKKDEEDTLGGLAGALQRKFQGKITLGSDESWVLDPFPTGFLAVDKAMGGGYGKGRICEIYGPYATGKTYLGDLALIRNQKEGGLSIKLTSEMDFDPDLFSRRGGDPDTLLVEPASTVEHVFDFAREVAKTKIKEGDHTPVAILWDSVALTSTNHLNAQGLEGSSDMTKARLIGQGAAAILQDLHNARIVFIATNQLRDKIQSGPRPDFNDHKGAKHTPGGKTWSYACTQRIELDFDGGYGSSTIKEKDLVLGRWVKGTVVKNRVAGHGGVFKFPVYEREGYEHPEFDGELTPFGIDERESLFWYYAQSPFAVFGPNKERFFENAGPVWRLSETFAGYLKNTGRDLKSFRKRVFPAFLEQVPELYEYNFDPSQEDGGDIRRAS